MECVALTGISRQVIRELVTNGIRTLEIRSPHNFLALLHLSPGDVIFLTEASGPDIVNGTGGLGKTPLLPNYLLYIGKNKAVFRNWEGQIFEIENGFKR